MRNLALGLSLLLLSCASPQDRGTIPPDAFQARAEAAATQLIDVRTADEFAAGHLENAVNLDWNSGQFEAAVGRLDKSRPVLLYCASGRRSAAAREHLVQQGFTDVADLRGGITAWVQEGHSLVK